MEILIPEVKSYLDALCVKFHVQNLSSLGEISENPSWKLENVVTTILSNNK